jgi:hypothetical protein
MSEPAIVIQELRKSVSASFCFGPLSLRIPKGVVCALDRDHFGRTNGDGG